MKEKWILNMKLETGSYTDDDNYTYTTTSLFHVKVTEGKITKQIKASEEVPDDNVEMIDAEGHLAVPSFKEMHNHLDKTYMGLDWKASIPVKNLKERLDLEARELKELADTAEMRADLMIQTLLSYGSTHIRTHVNI